jgi:hypothetical protein
MRKLLVIISLFSLFLVSNVIVRAAMPSTVEVTVTSSFDKYNKGISQGAPVSLALGSNLSLDASGIDTENTFAFWVINGVVRNDLSELDSIRVKSSMHIQAVFHKAGEHAVLFVDSNGKLISTEYVLNGEDVTAPSYSGYTKLGMSVDTSTPWKTLNGLTSLTAINSSRVYVLQYTTDVAEVTITLIGATVSSVVANRNDVVTLVASNVSTFKYWKNASNEVLSFESTYVFTATKNMTITAEYADETQTPANLVTISEDLGIREGYDTYVGRFELQSGSAFEFGFLVSKTSNDVTFETSDVEIVKSNAYSAETNEFIMSFTTGSYMSVKAYLIADEGTLVNYVSGSNRTTELSGFASDLFISEYIEGSSNNKAIEIYNGTGTTVNLDVYQVKLYANGATSPTTSYQLTGLLEHNATYVIASGSSVQALLDLSDATSSVVNFNGDDAIELVNGSSIIDSFGQVGFDPGASWSENGVISVNLTLIRKSNVNTGRTASTTTFNISSEWTATSEDDFSNLGSHTMTQGTVMSSSEKTLEDLDSLSIPLVKKDTIQLTLPVLGPNQSTITWTSDSPHLITNTGVVTLPSGQPETVILTARVVNGSSVRNREFQVFVGLTDADKVALDAEALSQPTALTEPTTLSLPATGTNGSTIVWTTESELVNVATGDITMPELGQVTVTLTATLTINSATEIVAFEILLGNLEANTPVTVVATYSGATTNMTAGNNAATIGLDSNIFNVLAIKNSQTNFIGLNSAGNMRIYYHSTGNGAELQFSIATGYEITEVKYIIGGTSGNARVALDSVTHDYVGSNIRNTTITHSGLSITSTSIKNINTTNVQIYLLSVEITYIKLNP